jgi:hypothetical protein
MSPKRHRPSPKGKKGKKLSKADPPRVPKDVLDAGSTGAKQAGSRFGLALKIAGGAVVVGALRDLGARVVEHVLK